jgi:ABC-2 type transport system permease protein
MFLRPLIAAALFVVFARLAQPAVTPGYLVTSVMAFNLIENTVVAAAYESRTTQTQGKLGGIALSPGGIWGFLFAQSFVAVVSALLQSMIVGVAFAWTLEVKADRAIEALAAVAIAVVAAFGLAVLGAAWTLHAGSFSAVSFSLGLALALGGAFYPMAALPAWLRSIAGLNPFTYVLDAIRAPLADSVTQVNSSLGWVLGAMLAVVPMGLAVILRLCVHWDESRLGGGYR